MPTTIIIPPSAALVKLDFASIITAAQAKLARIIEREGDLNGERRKPEYLAQLAAEEYEQRAMRDYCMAHYKGGRNERV